MLILGGITPLEKRAGDRISIMQVDDGFRATRYFNAASIRFFLLVVVVVVVLWRPHNTDISPRR